MNKKYKLNLKYWLNLENPIACYFLGLFWADGSVEYYKNKSGEIYGRMTMILVENDFSDVISFLQKDQWSLGIRHPKNRKTVLQCRTSEYQYIRFLIDHDYHIKSGASAYKILLKIPDHLKHYWWRGYFDGDGSFNFKKGNKYGFGISACLDQNWNFCENLMNELNISYFISKRETEAGNSSELVVNNFEGVKKFANFIYDGYESDSIGLKRKYQKWVKLWQTKESSESGYNRAEHFRERMQKKYQFLTPNGELLELTNLTKYCKDNNLNSAAWNCAIYKKRPYKGYKLIKKFK